MSNTPGSPGKDQVLSGAAVLTPGQVDGYLARMAYTGPREPNLETLGALMRAHLLHVPFENLDIYDLHKPVSLAAADVYHKIVEQQRGGYCFELNTLFYVLLKTLGYTLYPVAARVVWGRDFVPPLSHRATVVTLDGQMYYCDVGFGGPGPKGPLPLREGQTHTAAGEEFRLLPFGLETRICRMEKGDWAAVLSFRNTPFEEADFPLLHEHFSQSPDSRFTQCRVINLCTPDGHVSLTGNQLTVKRGAEVETTTVDEGEALRQTLQRCFGLCVDGWPDR